jgi:hypothetical protein
MFLTFSSDRQFVSIRGGPIMIAKLFRDGTVWRHEIALRKLSCKFGFFLNWNMMSEIAGDKTRQNDLNRP